MHRNNDTGVTASGTPMKSVVSRSSIPRCPKCNSTAVRKREMIVKAGTYDRAGGSVSVSGKLSPRVFVSRGRNHWVEELKPMSYGWPILLALFLYGHAASPETSVGIGFYLLVVFNVLWFMAVQGSKAGFRKEWACSKCGEIWDPSESEESRV